MKKAIEDYLVQKILKLTKWIHKQNMKVNEMIERDK